MEPNPTGVYPYGMVCASVCQRVLRSKAAQKNFYLCQFSPKSGEDQINLCGLVHGTLPSSSTSTQRTKRSRSFLRDHLMRSRKFSSASGLSSACSSRVCVRPSPSRTLISHVFNCLNIDLPRDLREMVGMDEGTFDCPLVI